MTTHRNGARDVRVAFSGTTLSTAEVQAALGDWWQRPDIAPVAPERDFARTGRGTPAGTLLRKSWQPAFIAADLKPGWIRTVRVMGEEIALYRSVAGNAHAVGARCAHRGLLLSTGMVDGEGIRCAYHGWKYDADGRCVAQPAEPKLIENVCIPGYPVHEYLGLIFIYMGGDAPPPPPRYEPFEQSGIVATFRLDCPWNYFHHLENAVDETHLAFLHDRSVYSAVNFAVPRIEIEETEYGFAQYGIRNGNLKRRKYVHMPNMTAWPQPPMHPQERGWREFLGWRVPVDDHSHVTIGAAHYHVDDKDVDGLIAAIADERRRLEALPPSVHLAMAVLKGEIRAHDIELRDPPSDMTMIQDFYAQIGQGAIADRARERLGTADLGVAMLRKLYEREMIGILRGREPTRWTNTIPMPHPGPLPTAKA
jgi:5,5'-dehydrodivanillate O-demethylase